ncbi:MAG TPA: BsuBI/PstI family type II restriction endonuclease [Longimicrobium sp.]|jgi:hypothetical protein
MTETLPPVPALDTIAARLQTIFPKGTEHRNYLVRATAARTVFVMFYIGALEGRGTWLRPNQVTRMTDAQTARTSDAERLAWRGASLLPQRGDISDRWFADNTREPIRDETIRNGLMRVGAVIERPGLSTTSSAPRYALAGDFAELFLLDDQAFEERVADWRRDHLSASALARVALLRRGVVSGVDADRVLVRFPNQETRWMSPGPSSEITRAVIEEFAPRFLEKPGVIWVSESRNKVLARDDDLARSVGLSIEAQRLLPDIILVDLGPRDPLLVFVEVVATDGPVNEKRKQDLLALIGAGGYDPRNAAFVTAFLDRGTNAFRAAAAHLAWDSFAWFASEPDRIVIYHSQESSGVRLSRLLKAGSD